MAGIDLHPPKYEKKNSTVLSHSQAGTASTSSLIAALMATPLTTGFAAINGYINGKI
jgi:hypothetical protein